MKCPNCGYDNPSTGRFCSDCGAALGAPEDPSYSGTKALRVPEEDLSAGRLFAGRYRIGQRLGRGGMGLVFRAEDTKLKRPVALKVLPHDLTLDSETRQRFVQEAQAASALDHPNICTIYEIDEAESGQMYIAMAYYGGETLKDKIERGPLAVKEAVDIAIRIGRGLARTHEVGLIHRDIKSANVVVTDRGEVKILDFGLAKLAGQTGLTKAGIAMGTVTYMSPEQARGQEVDHRTDIWSLGIIMYEMLTGQLPFKGDRDQTVIYSILNVEPEPACVIKTDIPPKLEKIVKKAMQKRPAERYARVEEMLKDLEDLRAAWGEGEPTHPIEPGEGGDDTEALAVRKPVAVITFENQTGSTSYDYLRKAIPNLLITSLEQSRYLNVVTWERMHDVLKQMGKPDVEVIDKSLGFELCQREGIDSIVVGTFTKAGEMFATDVKVLDVQSKELLRSASSKGEGVDSILRTQIDDLSRDISRGIGIAERDIDRSRLPIADVTTASMDAYDYFLKGRDAYEKLYNEDARRLLEKAVKIDPSFAVAYLYLAWTYGRLRETKSQKEAFEKAKTHSDRSTRKERLYIEASYADSVGLDETKRFRILQQISEEYPQEKRVHHLLASHYRVKKRFYEAVEEYDKVLDLDPSYGWAMNELAYLYADAGNFEKAHKLFQRYAAASPGDANPIDSMGELYFRMGKLDEAVGKYKEALAIKPDFYYAYWEIAYISALKEDYASTMEWIDAYIDKAPSFGTRAVGFEWRALYRYWQGRLKTALEESQMLADLAEEASSESWKSAVDKLRGWIYYDMEDFELSRKHFESCAERIRSRPEEFVPAQLSYSLWTADWIPRLTASVVFALALVDLKQGQIDPATFKLTEIRAVIPKHAELLHAELLLAQGSYEKAITVCEKSSPWRIPYMSDTDRMLTYNLPALRDALPRAYAHKGDLDRAIAEYWRLLTIDPKSTNRRLIHPKYHYRLAKLYDDKDWPARAIEEYEIFLRLWREADPGIHEVEDARRRLAELAGRA